MMVSKLEPTTYSSFQNFQDDGSGTSCYQCCINCCGYFWGCCAAWIPCCRCCVNNPYTTIDQGHEGIIEKFGKYQQTVKPGLYYVNPCTEVVTQISQKTQIIDLEKQACITRDNVSILLDAAVYYKIINTYNAKYRITNLRDAVNFLTFSSLRNVAGQLTLQEFLEKRVEIAQQIQDQGFQTFFLYLYNFQLPKQLQNGELPSYLVTQSNNFLYFVVVFIKDVIISSDVQFALSSVAKESRYAKSKVISAKADVKAARLMKESSEILNTNSAMQIRFLDTMLYLTKSGGSKLILSPKE